jgi:thiamine-phosphate pyrophosphorylase
MLLVITIPEPVPGEITLWEQLLAAGADALLLRRPGWTAARYAQALEQTPPACYPKIMVAGHWRLYHQFGLMGVHVNEQLRRQTTMPQLRRYRRQGCCVSTGIHNVFTLPLVRNEWDLLLLSPVFDSISKPGYKGQQPPDLQLPLHTGPARVLALGGVHAGNAAKARQMGFNGLALLGAIWQTPAKAVEQLQHIKSIWNDPTL